MFSIFFKLNRNLLNPPPLPKSQPQGDEEEDDDKEEEHEENKEEESKGKKNKMRKWTMRVTSSSVVQVSFLTHCIN